MTAPRLLLFSRDGCPACEKAKALLRTEGLEVEERVLDTGQPKLPGVTYYTAQELRQLIPGVKTVPQVLLGSTVIGGLIELQRWLAANRQP